MIKRVSILVLLIGLATAIASAQTSTQQPPAQQPGNTADPTEPTASQGPQSDDKGQMQQPAQPGDSDQVEQQNNSGGSSSSNSESSASSQSSAQDREQTGTTSIHGTIAKVDTIGNNVTIQTDNNEEETLSMDANTQIKVNGQAATVADLKPGQRVIVGMDGQKAVAVDVSEPSSQIK
jgi:hypothetical protein